MEQLKQDLTKEIQSIFDIWIDDEFNDFESFESEYDDFVYRRFNDGDTAIDIDDFASVYDFSYFDALTIIKEYYVDIGEHFEDYDDKDKIWEMVCYICARDATYEITHDPKYKKFYHHDPVGDFKNECDEKIQYLENRCWGNKVIDKVEKNTKIRYFQHLKEFDTSKAEEDLKIINLIYQKYMKQVETTSNEDRYIGYCDYLKKEYQKLFDFKCRGLAAALI